jgi:hypothetical protein
LEQLQLETVTDLVSQKTQNSDRKFDLFCHHSQKRLIRELAAFVKVAQAECKNVRVDRADLTVVRVKDSKKNDFEIIRSVRRVDFKAVSTE